MDWYMSIIFLQILLINFISCRFIHFENGYEYSYQYTSDSTIEGVGNFKTDAKVSLDFLSFSSSLLLNAKGTRYQLHVYHGERKLRFDGMIMIHVYVLY
jgi:hypothetical protein